MLDTQYGRPAARAAGEVVYNNIRFNPESVPVLILASPLNRSYESQAHLRQGVQLALSHIGTGDDVPPILVLDLLRESAESAGSKLAKKEFDDPRLHIQGYATFRGEAVWTALTRHHSEGISRWEEPMAARGKYIREAISELARGIQARTENGAFILDQTCGPAPITRYYHSVGRKPCAHYQSDFQSILASSVAHIFA